MRALFLVLVHKDDFDQDYAKEAIDMMMDSIAAKMSETDGDRA